MLDSIIKHSDSSYTKPYYRTDFVTAAYYVNKKDSSLCQLMKDSAGVIRQMIVTQKGVSTFFGQFFLNGQLQAKLPLDEFGHYHGTSTYYYKDGSTQTTGDYIHGLKVGQWKNFNEKGTFISTDTYDQNGQLVNSIKK